MWYLVGIVAVIVVVVWGRWIKEHEETVRRYRDHIAAAADETAPEPRPGD